MLVGDAKILPFRSCDCPKLFFQAGLMESPLTRVFMKVQSPSLRSDIAGDLALEDDNIESPALQHAR